MIINFDSIKPLTLSEVYNQVSQEDIYSYYFGQQIRSDKIYNCCFHDDGSPSLGFYKTEYGNIRYKCFACGAEGGAIDFVMRKQNLIFPLALKTIQRDFGLNKNLQLINKTNSIPSKSFKESPSERLKILPISRPFNSDDAKYWEQYGLTLLEVLNAGIFACSHVYYIKDNQEKLYAYHTDDNPIYCITISKGIYKIYRPLSKVKGGKWFSNAGSEDLQGMNLLSPKRDILFIISSMKDALVAKKLGVESIAPSGEGVRIPDKVWDYLEATSEIIVYFNDCDKAGYNYTFRHCREKPNTFYVFIPRYYGVKDLSDFVKVYGIEEARKLMNTLLRRVNRWRKRQPKSYSE